MALKDIKSLYGPTNNVGTKGTGGLEGSGDKDILAFETGKGITGQASKYGPAQYGKPRTGTDPLAGAPAQRSGEMG